MRTFQDLQEGLQDPNIFKAFFLAGGPGSGKSYVVRSTTGGTGLRIVNSDDIFEKYLKDAGFDMDMSTAKAERETEERDKMRKRAKKLTRTRMGDVTTGKGGYLEGRIGLIIDGTGKDYAKIADQATKLKQLGYDVHMIFVNTSLDTALERNAKRERTVPTDVATRSWNAVQRNIGKFSQYFRQNFVVVDNNDADEDVMTPVFKQIQGLLKKPVRSPIAKAWVTQEMKRRGITRRPKGF
jgi:cytidylate kinase